MSSHTPGPWAVGYRAIDVVCVNAKCGGTAKLFDVRGWGYLTGTGHGGLGLPDDEAYEIQKANARLAAAAPDLVAAATFAKAALEALVAYEADYGEQLPDDYEIGRIDDSRNSASFRIRVGHIRRLAAAISSASEPRL
jgi:hypothetical protein